MRRGWLRTLVLLGAAAFAADGEAAEYGFSSYGLGGNAFGAGITPPPGVYVSEALVFYEGEIGRPVPFGRVVLNAGPPSTSSPPPPTSSMCASRRCSAAILDCP